MSKRTTRRSVSVKGVSYVRAQRIAGVLGCSVSEVIERGIKAMAAETSVAEVKPDEVPEPEPRDDSESDLPGPDFQGSHFTF